MAAKSGAPGVILAAKNGPGNHFWHFVLPTLGGVDN